jgi:hypothetical protein
MKHTDQIPDLMAYEVNMRCPQLSDPLRFPSDSQCVTPGLPVYSNRTDVKKAMGAGVLDAHKGVMGVQHFERGLMWAEIAFKRSRGASVPAREQLSPSAVVTWANRDSVTMSCADQAAGHEKRRLVCCCVMQNDNDVYSSSSRSTFPSQLLSDLAAAPTRSRSFPTRRF